MTQIAHIGLHEDLSLNARIQRRYRKSGSPIKPRKPYTYSPNTQ